MNSIKDMVKDGKKARITHYKLGELWYETECGFKFPVPVHLTEEVGEATFKAEDKAIMLMRYIRKHVALLEEARKTNVADFPGGPLECPEDFDDTTQ